jgi:hypothetical protein
MQRSLGTFVRLVLVAVATVALPTGVGAQQGAAGGQGQPPEGLPQELTFDGLFTVRYPANWSELPSVYRNSRTLVSVPKSEHGKLSAVNNAYGAGERVARVMITIEQRLSHDEAVQRLREIANSYSTPATFLEIGGWPALEQSRVEQRPLKGASPLLQQPPQSQSPALPPERLTRHKTTAIAAGTLLIRLEASMPPQGSEPLERDTEAIGRSVRLSGGAAQGPAPGATAASVTSLRDAEGTRSTVPADTVIRIPSSDAGASGDSTDAGQPAPGFPARAVTGGSELEVAASSNGRYVVVGTNGGWANSQDAGRTWSATTGVACPGGFTSCNGDPSVAVGKSGAFYAAIIGWPTGTNRQDPAGTASTVVLRSTNNGQSFSFVTNAVVCNNGGAGSCFPDQEHITADRLLAGSGGDQVYSTWRNFDAADQDPAIVCSQDNGSTWSGVVNVGSGAVPRIGIGGDGFVYVVYRSGGNVMLNKYSPCSAGMTQQAGFPQTVTAVTDVTCPVAGLDRCNDGNILSSHTVAVDDVNPAHVYVAYATNTSAGVNENVLVRASIDGGLTWAAGRVTQVNTTGNARRYMPWACAVGGTAYVTWYDHRFAIPAITTDLADFFGGSAKLDASNDLLPGAEFRISSVSDPLCASGWPCAPRATGDSESCPTQPQLAGVCLDGAGNGSGQRCDFTTGPACPAGESCNLGGGCPKYGDYNGNACAGGRLFMAWASATAPTGVTPASTGIDTFTDSKVVCCVPQIQTAGALNFGSTCSNEPVSKELQICNQGKALLQVTGITSSSSRYAVATPNPGYPMDITEGNCQTLEVTFTPNAPGTANATLTIASNDPAFPTVTVNLTGSSGAPDVEVTGSGQFGNVCATVAEERTISVCNTGSCPLNVTSAIVVQQGSDAACTDFTIINNPFAGSVDGGSCVPLTVKYTPTSLGSQSCRLKVTSDDPDEPAVYIPLTGNTPSPLITVTPDQFFPATVIQSVGACQSSLLFPVANTGTCPATVQSITIGGENASNYSLAGAPGIPITLNPGEQVGDGTLKTVFKPDVLDRDRLGSVSVTWLSNPIANTTTTDTRLMCGEGTLTGARVLVRLAGVAVPVVEKLSIQRLTANRNRPIVDTVGTFQNLALQTWTPAAGTSCQAFSYHKEFGTVSNASMLAPGSYTVTATVVINKKRMTKTVSFDAETCTFNPTVVIDF